MINEAVRILKPGGLFVFIEKEESGILPLIDQFFPRTVLSGKVAGSDSTAGSGKSKKLGRRKQKKMEMEIVKLQELYINLVHPTEKMKV